MVSSHVFQLVPYAGVGHGGSSQGGLGWVMQGYGGDAVGHTVVG